MTIISHKHKFIFLRNPKAGSTSVADVLSKYNEYRTTSIKSLPFGKHDSLATITNRMEKQRPDVKLSDYFIFTTISNPWKRVVSLFFYQRKMRQYPFRKKPKLTFQQYVSGYKKYFRLIQKVEDFTQSLPKSATINKIIRIEDIGKKLPIYLKKRCKIKVDPKLFAKKKNTTEHKHYSYYYDDKTRKIVADYFKKDIELGKYTFKNRLNLLNLSSQIKI